MPSRTRSRILHYTSGGKTTYKFWSPTYLNGPYAGLTGYTGATSWQEVQDSYGPRPWPIRSFVSTRRYSEPLVVNGDYNGTYKEIWEEYKPPNRANYAYCPTITPINWDYWRTKALANINPNKPEVDIPVFIAELRDLPRMLAQAVRLLRGRATKADLAGSYVAYSFGWAPLISDIGKMLKLQALIAKRVQYLKKAASKKGNRVKRQLGTNTIDRPGYSYQLSWLNSPPSIKGRATVTEVQKVWFTAQLQLIGQLPANNAAYQAAASAAVIGSRFSVSTLWEAMPWSWLMDYFVNIGDILEAGRGGIPYHVSNMCIMAESIVHDRVGEWSHTSGLQCTGGSLTTHVKQRSVSYQPMPMLSMRPFFTKHMAGILASIAASRSLGGRTVAR
nr:MAG: hypothetical protein 1 [Leviviridae sp.]